MIEYSLHRCRKGRTYRYPADIWSGYSSGLLYWSGCVPVPGLLHWQSVIPGRMTDSVKSSGHSGSWYSWHGYYPGMWWHPESSRSERLNWQCKRPVHSDWLFSGLRWRLPYLPGSRWNPCESHSAYSVCRYPRIWCSFRKSGILPCWRSWYVGFRYQFLICCRRLPDP